MFLRVAIALMTAMMVYSMGVKPFMGVYCSTKNDLRSALRWTPDDSTLHFAGGNITRAIELNNGDLTQYSLWTNLAIKLAERGDKAKATDAINMALYYYPDFEPAKQVLEALNKWNLGAS